jgi:hypothetical protein
MDYKARHLESKLRETAKHFKIVFVLGARQVGKSTLLHHVFPSAQVVLFEPLQDLYNARTDPDLFLNNFPSPLILDEVQYVPELLPTLKRRVDASDKKGQYFLTSSQNLSVLKTVAESRRGELEFSISTVLLLQKCWVLGPKKGGSLFISMIPKPFAHLCAVFIRSSLI